MFCQGLGNFVYLSLLACWTNIKICVFLWLRVCLPSYIHLIVVQITLLWDGNLFVFFLLQLLPVAPLCLIIKMYSVFLKVSVCALGVNRVSLIIISVTYFWVLLYVFPEVKFPWCRNWSVILFFPLPRSATFSEFKHARPHGFTLNPVLTTKSSGDYRCLV